MIQGGIKQQIELASKIESLTQIEVFIDDVCEHYKLGEDKYGNILIVLTEAVNNAITHGNKLDVDKMVSLNLEKSLDGLEFNVRDEGGGFDYDSIPDPTLPENIEKIRGRGIFIMRALSDEIEFTDEGRAVKLKFSLSNN